MIVSLHTGRVEWCAYALKYSVGASVVVGSAIVTACKRSQLLVHWPEHISCKHCVHFSGSPEKDDDGIVPHLFIGERHREVVQHRVDDGHHTFDDPPVAVAL